MKNDALDWVMNFSPTTPKPFCAWKPIPNVSRFTTVVFTASSPTASPIKSFSASSAGTSSSFASCTARKITRANSAPETADVICERRLTPIIFPAKLAV
jgi:hypothetical protein